MNFLLRSYIVAGVAAFVLVGGFVALQSALADSASTSVSVGNAFPTVTAVTVSPDPIVLTENSTTSVTINATITDSNGCEDVFSSGTITASLYRSGVSGTSTCTASDLSCYRPITLVEVGNTCSGSSDTTGDAVATTGVFWFADSTNGASSSFDAQNWLATVFAADAAASTSQASSAGTELNVLVALNVTASISYGSLAANTSSTAAQNQVATTTNTGNATIDIQFSGTDMTSGGNTLAATEQRYGTSSADHAALSYQLSTSATTRNMNIGKAQASSTAAASSTYWGINIPSGQAAGNYTGTDTLDAAWSN